MVEGFGSIRFGGLVLDGCSGIGSSIGSRGLQVVIWNTIVFNKLIFVLGGMNYENH